MATAASRSSTRRTSGIGAAPEDAGSASKAGTPAHHRRARSLSRNPWKFPPAEPSDESVPAPTPKRRFVNTVRGSQLPEVSLDDLANEFFPTVAWELEEAAERGRVGARAARRVSDAGFAMETESSRRRGRSVSRKGSLGSSGASAGKGDRDTSARRRRSVSVARYRSSDLERNLDRCHYNEPDRLVIQGSKNDQHPLFSTPRSNPTLKRSLSAKDLQLPHDSYSSQLSSLTDEDGSSICSTRGPEKTVRTIYAQKIEHPSEDGVVNGFYDAMRKEVRHAVEEIRTELERVMVKTKPSITSGDDIGKNTGVIQVIDDIRRNYDSKLEESEKRKQQLLAELMAEEHRGQELTKMARELLPEPKQMKQERPLRARKRSNEKTSMSKRLSEEAEKYIEDFISNMEDTDLSSFDGERSDTSSTLGGSRKVTDPLIWSGIAELPGLSEKATSLPTETDGVILPWLQWETVADCSPRSKSQQFTVSSQVTKSCEKEQGRSPCYDSSHVSTSSYGSCSPKCIEFSANSRGTKAYEFGEIRSYIDSLTENRLKRSSFHIEEYLKPSHEETLFDTFRHRRRIDSGEVIICSGSSRLYGFW